MSLAYRFLFSGLTGILIAAAVAGCAQDVNQARPTPYDEEFALAGEADVRNPDKTPIPREDKADAVYPPTFDLVDGQTPVRSQGRRGVCSIFATTAQVENIYRRLGTDAPDFSEQFLQWSVKNEIGAFADAEGSNGRSNLTAVSKYGTVEEAAWPYEAAPWSASNDAACVGETRPTKCYTNGEPPASALAAPRFKVANSRWINVASMKHHMVTQRTGVVVGMTFFYQAWNHGASSLPVSAEDFRGGFVAYPNDKDKELSLAKRAGHAVLLVGWDDELTLPMRDADGNIITDENNNPVLEKGFWLFKNSWGTAGFGIDNPFGAGYGWLSYRYVSEYADATIADVAELRAKEVCTDEASADEDFDGQANCADFDCRNDLACLRSLDISTGTALAIPDDGSTARATQAITEVGTIANATVTLQLDHPAPSEVTLTLVHNGTAYPLALDPAAAGPSLQVMAEVPGLLNKSVTGNWTLIAVDNLRGNAGAVKAWKVNVKLR